MAKWTRCGRGALIGVALVVSGWLNGTATTAAQRDGEDKAARLEFIVTIDGIDAGFFTARRDLYLPAGWPVKWELSDLDASGNDVMIETIEIAHEGFEVE